MLWKCSSGFNQWPLPLPSPSSLSVPSCFSPSYFSTPATHKYTPCPGEPSPTILIKSSQPRNRVVGEISGGPEHSLQEEAISTHPLPARSITSMRNRPPWLYSLGYKASLVRGTHPPIEPGREGNGLSLTSTCSLLCLVHPSSVRSLASVEVSGSPGQVSPQCPYAGTAEISPFPVGSFP